MVVRARTAPLETTKALPTQTPNVPVLYQTSSGSKSTSSTFSPTRNNNSQSTAAPNLIAAVAAPLISHVISNLFQRRERVVQDEDDDESSFNHTMAKMFEKRREMQFEEQRQFREEQILRESQSQHQHTRNLVICGVVVVIAVWFFSCNNASRNQSYITNTQSSRSYYLDQSVPYYGFSHKKSGNNRATAPKSASSHPQTGYAGYEDQSTKAQQNSQNGYDSSGDERRNDPPKDRRNQDRTNTTVGYDRLGRVVRVSAVVRLENLGRGSAPTAAMRKWIQQIGQKSDVAGHILANMFGGSGSDADNIVPMSSKFNNGDYKAFELYVRGWLRELNRENPGQQVEARISIHLKYSGDSWRPYKIKFCVDFYVNGRPLSYIDATFYCP